jgi:hypothetical protein
MNHVDPVGLAVWVALGSAITAFPKGTPHRFLKSLLVFFPTLIIGAYAADWGGFLGLAAVGSASWAVAKAFLWWESKAQQPNAAASSPSTTAEVAAVEMKLPGTKDATPTPPKTTAPSIRLVGVVVAILLLLGFGLVASRGIRTTRRANTPAEWTPELRQQLLARFSNATRTPYVAEETGKAEIANCMFEGLTSAMPGGPREAERLGEARVAEIAGKVGSGCGLAYAKRVTSSKEWIPQFAPLYTYVCVLTNGESEKEHCSCFAREAPRHFASPAAFMAFEKTPDERLTAAERATVLRMRRSCLGASKR